VQSRDLRNAGLKTTLPRVKVLEVLENSSLRHLSAEDIYKTLMESDEQISIATVYRVLSQFEGAGLITRRHFEGGTAVFELSSGKHHDHIVCVSCGKVEEFSDEGFEKRQAAIATRLDYEVSDRSLVLYGRCAECRSDKRAAAVLAKRRSRQ
jgi:Fur family ferric uptake transcriptional regulator